MAAHNHGHVNQAFQVEDSTEVSNSILLTDKPPENNNKDSVLSDLYTSETATKVTEVVKLGDVENGELASGDGDDDTRCGFACFRPEWLQRFATKGYFMLIFSILAVVQGMGWSYMTGTITTIQKRFKISSQTTGIVISGNEISQVIFSVILGYYGGKGHRPRWIALGVLFSAAACVLLATPHLFYGAGHDALMLTEEYAESAALKYTNGGNSSTGAYASALQGFRGKGKLQLCSKTKTSQGDDCDKSDATILPLVFIFMSQFVAGIGVLLFFSLGGPYLDDNINKGNSPMLFGITMSLRLIGPTLGFIFASGCLKVYIAPHLTPFITSDDPRWLGAWWLGWLILGALMAVTAVLISLFPKKLPKTVEREKKAALEKSQSEVPEKTKQIEDGADVKQSMKQIFEDVKGLAKNRINLFNNLASFCYIFSAIGYWTYMPKYLETVFMQSAITASYVSGLVGIATQSAGLLLSGYLISKYKPSARFLSGWNIVIGCLYTIVKISFTQMGCSGERLTFQPDSGTSALNLTTSCNADCNCPTNKFAPVCSKSTNQLFYSACHAGCTSFTNGTISNCSCLPSPAATVETGNCTEGCYNMFLVFLALNALIKLIDGSGRVGNMLVSYRCVHPKDKSLSISLTIGLLSLFAFLPGPILFGYIFDSVCLIWGTKCGGKGNCWMYDGEKLRYAFNLTAAGVTFLGAFFDIFVWYYAKDLDLYDEDKNLQRWAKEKADREEKKRQKKKHLK